MGAHEEHEERLGAPGVEGCVQGHVVAQRLVHVGAAHLEHAVVHPDPGELPARPAGLRQLVLVVREDQVEAPSVDLEHRTEERLRHRRALDVPARAPRPPGGIPEGVLVGLVPLPEREVPGVLLAGVGLLLLDLVGPLPREPPVLGEPADPEVDVTLGLVGEAPGEELLDQRDLLADGLGCPRLDVRPSKAEAVGVLDVPGSRLGGQLGAVPGGRLVDLVVDVGDVLDEGNLVAGFDEPPAEPRRDDKGPRVADVDPPVDGRAAEVHADRAGGRRQRIGVVGQGVVDTHGRPRSLAGT